MRPAPATERANDSAIGVSVTITVRSLTTADITADTMRMATIRPSDWGEVTKSQGHRARHCRSVDTLPARDARAT